MKSLDSRSDLPPDPPVGSNLSHQIADFMFLPSIYFILALRALESIECIRKYWETLCDESR